MPPTVNLSHASLVFSASEIILISKYIKQRIDSCVIMGIGEPFDNYDNVSNDIKHNTPIKPKLEANTAKIKSVCISGK